MLTRLIKYELKATGRVLLPLYAVLLVFAAISKLIFAFSDNSYSVPAVISTMIYIMIMIGMFVMTFVVMIQRFYKNLLSDEGYLMFTLPTMTWKHITSKLLVSTIWNIGSSLAAILSIVILAFDEIFFTGLLPKFFRLLGEFFNSFGLNSGLIILEFILAGIICMASGMLIIYASIALGHLFNQHRVLASLGAFLALSTVSQILFFCVTSLPGLDSLSEYVDSLDNLQASAFMFHWVMWFIIIFFGLLSAGYFFITNYILNKRLNLE